MPASGRLGRSIGTSCDKCELNKQLSQEITEKPGRVILSSIAIWERGGATHKQAARKLGFRAA
jgi:hypothetical protein